MPLLFKKLFRREKRNIRMENLMLWRALDESKFFIEYLARRVRRGAMAGSQEFVFISARELMDTWKTIDRMARNTINERRANEDYPDGDILDATIKEYIYKASTVKTTDPEFEPIMRQVRWMTELKEKRTA